jgi:ribosomal protein L31
MAGGRRGKGSRLIQKLFRLLGFPPVGLVELDVCRTCHTFLIAGSDESVHTVIDVKPDNK